MARSSAALAQIGKFVKSGCEDRRAKDQGLIQLPVRKDFPIQKSGIRKSKTSRWRAAVLIFVQLCMVAHIIQWRFMGRTVSPIEPSETMQTLQGGAINAGFIFFAVAILATLILDVLFAAGVVTFSLFRISARGC